MKALLFFTALSFLMAGAVIIFREPDAKAQPEHPVIKDLTESRFDSTVDRLSKKVDAAAMAPKVKTRIVYRYRQPKEAPRVMTVVIPDTGTVYEFPATQYGNVAIVQREDYNRVMGRDSAQYEDMPVMVEVIAQETKDSIGGLAKFLHFITKPFRKNHDKE